MVIFTDRRLGILRRLAQFLQLQNHEDGDYVFWSDLASSHYAPSFMTKASIFSGAFIRDKGINFFRKENNPLNVQKLRPIEKYCGILKSKVYNGGWTAKIEQQLK